MIFVLGVSPELLAASKQPKAKITEQPVGSTVELGDTVELHVAYTSTTAATCQWRHKKVPLAGATDVSYVIDSVLPEDAGTYDVVITNSGGATTSRTVVLAVNLAPASLPVDAVLDGSLTMRVGGDTVPSDKAYVVTGATTLQDPEAPLDTYSFTYTRQAKNKAKLVITGNFYAEDYDDDVAAQETYTLTFTGVSSDGELLATASGRGSFELPEGQSPSKLNFTAKGTIAIQMVESSAPASGSLSLRGGTLTLSESDRGATNVMGGSLSLTGSNTYTGATTINTGTLTLGSTGVITNDLGTGSLILGSTSSDSLGIGGVIYGITSLNSTIQDASFTFTGGTLDLSTINFSTGTLTLVTAIDQSVMLITVSDQSIQAPSQ